MSTPDSTEPLLPSRVIATTEEEYEKASQWMERAAEEAHASGCQHSRNGALLTSSRGTLIGHGHSGPPGGDATQQRCGSMPSGTSGSERSCCVHAEQRAILNAMDVNNQHLVGARLYVACLDEAGAPCTSDGPDCTDCSKLCLEVGIAEIAVVTPEGLTVYETGYYNQRAFEHVRPPEATT